MHTFEAAKVFAMKVSEKNQLGEAEQKNNGDSNRIIIDDEEYVSVRPIKLASNIEIPEGSGVEMPKDSETPMYV